MLESMSDTNMFSSSAASGGDRLQFTVGGDALTSLSLHSNVTTSGIIGHSHQSSPFKFTGLVTDPNSTDLSSAFAAMSMEAYGAGNGGSFPTAISAQRDMAANRSPAGHSDRLVSG